MESFLKEQLRRIEELTARLSSLERHAAELTSERERARETLSHGPLADVKDVRTYNSMSARRHPRSSANDSPRRRSRKRRS